MERTAAHAQLSRTTPEDVDVGDRPALDPVGWRRMVPSLALAQAVAVIAVAGRHPLTDARVWPELVAASGFCLSVGILAGAMLTAAAARLQGLSRVAGPTAVIAIVLAAYVLVYQGAAAWMSGLASLDGTWQLEHLGSLLRGGVVAACAGALMAGYIALADRNRAAQSSRRSDRLQALQSRIRPHFLFNSMNSVASLIPTDPELAERALQDLADVFRMLLADARTLVPISVEVELSRQYLNIEKLRLGDRLQVKWTLSEVPRSTQIPALTLQPLLENAVYHGIEPRFAGGTIHVQLWTDRGTLNIMISNPLPDSGGQARKQGNRIAIANVLERLHTHFGRRASMQSVERSGQYHVSIRLPVVRG